MKTILAVVADPHSGSRTGLCPSEVELETTAEGEPAIYRASAVQRTLFDAWCSHWRKMALIKQALHARLVVVVDGDGADDNKYSKAVLISANKNDIAIAVDGVLAPMIEVADKWYMVRGTEAHSGECGWLEEGAAKRNGATPNETAGTASWWFLPLKVAGLRVHIAHHPPTSAYTPHTEDALAGRISTWLRAWYNEMGEPLPDLAFFGHLHFHGDSGAAKKPRVFLCPGWQATTSYLHRRGRSGIMRPVGGWWLVCEDGHHNEPELELYRYRRNITWQSTN